MNQCRQWLFVIAALATPLVNARAESPGDTVVFTHVSVIPMDRDRVIHDQNVVITGGRISSIGPASSTTVPRSATIIPAAGKFLVPGFTDMHVHIFEEGDLLLYVANGVTSVRNMWGWKLHLGLRERVRTGALLGPSIHTAGAIVDGDPPTLRGSAVVRNVHEADSVVAAQRRDGFDFIKVYGRLTPDGYKAVASAAEREGLKIAGHVPSAVGLQLALSSRQSSIEHMTGYVQAALSVDSGTATWSRELSDAKLKTVAARTRATGVWNVPTLVVLERGDMSSSESGAFMQRKEIELISPGTRRYCCRTAYKAEDDLAPATRALRKANRTKVVKALSDAGARILVGTDTGNPFVVPGFSFADELKLLVEAGLTPYQALRGATSDAAEYLGSLENSGTIAPGKRADMVLLGGNPLKSIDHVRKIEGVVIGGRWLSAADLTQLLEKQRAAY